MSLFKTVPAAKVQRSKFDLSHNRKLSCKIGELVPVMCQECIPGDEWKISSSVFGRLAPLVSPMMHKLEIFVHGFFIPMRILYETYSDTRQSTKSWEAFLTGANADPMSQLVPTAAVGEVVPVGGLADHLGIPPGSYTNADAHVVNIMPFMAYFMIWNDYYRDENLDTAVDLTDTVFCDAIVGEGLKKRAWEKDYFTSCWPWAQKGVASAAVIEIADDAAGALLNVDGSAATGENIKREATSGHIQGVTSSKEMYLDAELTLDIQELRRANKMQIWMERTARAGSRLIEFLKGHYGVWPRDERLQRPEYIGGMRMPFVISDVVNTSGFDNATGTPDPTNGQPVPMGTLAGKGIAYGESGMMYKRVDEHGYIMLILSVRPEAVYYQGLSRMFSRKTYLDLPYPEFADMGEQEVLNKEIYFGDVLDTVNDAFFGYQSRYADYKYIPNSLHGTFRTTLEFWTMARKFASAPDLNDDFIHVDESADDLQRVFAVQDVEHVYLQVQHQIECDRPLPFFNIPSLE